MGRRTGTLGDLPREKIRFESWRGRIGGEEKVEAEEDAREPEEAAAGEGGSRIDDTDKKGLSLGAERKERRNKSHTSKSDQTNEEGITKNKINLTQLPSLDNFFACSNST